MKKVTFEEYEKFVRNRPHPDTQGFYKLWRLRCKETGYTRHEVEYSEDDINGKTEYTRIQPKCSGIEICMYIDESTSFKRWNHPLWVIISDGDPYDDTWIGMSISDKPIIINRSNDNENGLSTDIIIRCRDFVAKFHPLLIAIAVETIDSSIIYDILSNHDWETLTSQEFLNLSSELTAIPELQNINGWMTPEEFGDYIKEEIKKMFK